MRLLQACTFVPAMIMAATGVTRAQDENEVAAGGVQILSFSSSSEGMSQEMGLKMAEGAANNSIGGSGGFSMGNMLGGVNPNDRSQLFGLLGNESVRDELKLTEQQYDGVKAVQKASQASMQKMISGMMAGGGKRLQLNGNIFKDVIAENQKQAEAAIEEILLPPQMQRVRQLAYQVEVENEGMGQSLIRGRLGKEVGVFDDQKQSLKDAAKKIDAETKLAIAKIKADARKRLLAKLSPDQRKAADELLGNYFDYEAESMEKRMRDSVRKIQQSREASVKPKSK